MCVYCSSSLSNNFLSLSLFYHFYCFIFVHRIYHLSFITPLHLPKSSPYQLHTNSTCSSFPLVHTSHRSFHSFIPSHWQTYLSSSQLQHKPCHLQNSDLFDIFHLQILVLPFSILLCFSFKLILSQLYTSFIISQLHSSLGSPFYTYSHLSAKYDSPTIHYRAHHISMDRSNQSLTS